MSFPKETDCRATPTGDGDSAPQLAWDDLRLRVSLLFSWTRLQIEKLFHVRRAAPRSSSLVHGGEKHFTLLGARRRPAPAPRRITDIFPISDRNDPPRIGRRD